MKHEHDKDYLDFLTTNVEVPAHLKTPMKKETQLSFHGNKILAKFLGLQLIGGIISLNFCPQFGVGKEAALWHHHFMHANELLCTVTCSAFFLCCSIMFSAIALRGEEWWWLYRRRLTVSLAFPAMFWGLLMFTRVSFPSLLTESPSHNFAVWFGIGAMVQFLWIFGRAKLYSLPQKAH